MNIEQAIDILKNSIADYVIGEYCEKCADNKICDDRNKDCYYQQAIDIVVTAYEKEKRLAETNLKDSEEFQDNMCNHRCILNSKVEELEAELEKEKEKNKKIEIIVNKLMPLAECSYWNYENHTCTHTCRGCDGLNEYNKRTSSGILIDKDRYCRLYEDGNAEKDTKFVDVEDLIKRHLKED